MRTNPFSLSEELKKSVLCPGLYVSTTELLADLESRSSDNKILVTRSSFSRLKEWIFDESRVCLKHRSGRFFNIQGISVQTTLGKIKSWDQPIIDQAEIGLLGLLATRIHGVVHFLVQKKIEPGNINQIQISPSLQATRSNFTRVHGGKLPCYLDLFISMRSAVVLYDQLQSEQGARFLRKRNRNVVIYTEDAIHTERDFVWLSLGQLFELVHTDNIVNMDLRTILSGLCGILLPNLLNNSSFGIGLTRPLTVAKGLRSQEVGVCPLVMSVFSKLTAIRTFNSIIVSPKPFQLLEGWQLTDEQIYRPDGKFFRVVPMHVRIDSREVSEWDQPMIEPAQRGLCALLVFASQEGLRFLVQFKVECGNRDLVEIAPTVQCLTGDFRRSDSIQPHYLYEILNTPPDMVLFDQLQSEEGGRFLNEENHYRIVLREEILEEIPQNFALISADDLVNLLNVGNYLNVQLRSLFFCFVAALSKKSIGA